MYFSTICTTDETAHYFQFLFLSPTALELSRFIFLMLIIKESCIFPEAKGKACTTRYPLIKVEYLPWLPHLSELWPLYWMKIEFTLCVCEPSCAVCHFDCIFFFPASAGVFIMWHAKTSILESVKLLKRESVHGSELEFLPLVFVLLLFLLVGFKLFFTHSCILSSVCYYFTILKQCQWRSAVVILYILSACPLLFTWTWSWRVVDLIPCSSVVQRMPDTSTCCLTEAFLFLHWLCPDALLCCPGYHCWCY